MTLTRCRACLAWEPIPPDARTLPDGHGNGYCRRFAPRPAFSGTLDHQPGEVEAAFPMTWNNDGCCEGLPNVWFVPVDHTVIK